MWVVIPFKIKLKDVIYGILVGAIIIFNNNLAFGSTRIKVIVIDAGHGGHDPGCQYAGKKEKDITLAIALELEKKIESQFKNIKVILTRSTDKFIPLNERAEIANKNKANFFISIHVNANPIKRFYGTETYTIGMHKTEENLSVSKRENAVVLLEDNYNAKYGGFDPQKPETNIIFTTFQDVNIKQSIKFATFVESSFKSNTSRRSLGVRQAGFIVLWKTTMPSVLIETGFLSNDSERIFLSSSKGQLEVADGIFKAFSQYKKELEN
jgi:N-acetylmuramoyl-L-alanine amidase